MESLWQWDDALGAKEDMPQCSDDSDSEILFSKFDSQSFLAKFARRLKKDTFCSWPVLSWHD
ncbi:hypothetical protein PQQ87_29030 [Paraburkholderia nemoris]|uniref:hypothetical protein n=1 Tax=Paraburkholderia nemoris TaxID=2793076 RepID=UPI0038B7AF0E